MNKKTALLKGLSIFTLILLVGSLTGCGSDRDLPLNGFSDGGTNPINYLLTYPMAYIINFFGNLFIDNSLAIGIIFLTIIVRFAAFPIYAGASNGNEVKTLRAKPELDALNKKYEGVDDPQLQQQKMMEQFAINKKYGINPFKSCMILPIQMAIFTSMFDVLYRVRVEGGKLSLTNTSFLGFDLATSFFESTIATKVFLVILAVLTGLTTAYHLKLTTANMANMQAQNNAAKPGMENQMQGMMKTMLLIQPLMIGWFALTSGAMGLYYVIGNVCSITQTLIMKKVNAKKMKEYLAEQEAGIVEVL